jgi:hypothetical protein
MTKDDAHPEETANPPVGFGRPPQQTRFQPGRSGNPRGRPKKPKSIEEKFALELARKVAVREDGKVRKIPKLDLWVRRVIANAIKGDHPASRILLQMTSASDTEIGKSIADRTIEDLNAEDREILQRHLAGLATEAGTTDAAGSR